MGHIPHYLMQFSRIFPYPQRQLLDGLTQILFINRLEQIVYTMILDGLHGIFIISCSKDNKGGGHDFLKGSKHIAIRQPDVGKYQIVIIVSAQMLNHF